MRDTLNYDGFGHVAAAAIRTPGAVNVSDSWARMHPPAPAKRAAWASSADGKAAALAFLGD